MKRGALPWRRVQVQFCRGKIRYEKLRDAVTSQKHQLRFRGRHGRQKQLHIYQCRYCNGWHLTHKEQYGD